MSRTSGCTPASWRLDKPPFERAHAAIRRDANRWHLSFNRDRVRETRISLVIAGGAGSIGPHLVRALHDTGDEALVIDDLSGESVPVLIRFKCW